jgi:phosphohistidine phosphatase SixA
MKEIMHVLHLPLAGEAAAALSSEALVMLTSLSSFVTSTVACAAAS